MNDFIEISFVREECSYTAYSTRKQRLKNHVKLPEKGSKYVRKAMRQFTFRNSILSFYVPKELTPALLWN